MDEDEDINNGITLSNEGIFNCFKKEFFGVFFVCLIISIIGFAELTNGVVKTSLIGNINSIKKKNSLMNIKL